MDLSIVTGLFFKSLKKDLTRYCYPQPLSVISQLIIVDAKHLMKFYKTKIRH